MNPNGLVALAMVRAFLAEQILPGVPDSLTGELRAALKILDTVAAELDALYPLLLTECRELLDLCGEICARQPSSETPTNINLATRCTAFNERYARGFTATTPLFEFYRAIKGLATDLINSLQKTANEPGPAQALARLYSLLGQHATARIPWQTVFSSPAATKKIELNPTTDLRRDSIPSKALN